MITLQEYSTRFLGPEWRRRIVSDINQQLTQPDPFFDGYAPAPVSRWRRIRIWAGMVFVNFGSWIMGEDAPCLW